MYVCCGFIKLKALKATQAHCCHYLCIYNIKSINVKCN